MKDRGFHENKGKRDDSDQFQKRLKKEEEAYSFHLQMNHKDQSHRRYTYSLCPQKHKHISIDESTKLIRTPRGAYQTSSNEKKPKCQYPYFKSTPIRACYALTYTS